MKKDIKIALCLIVKNTEQELLLLERCLENTAPYVDGIFITFTNKPGESTNYSLMIDKEISNKLIPSHFEWVNDFAKARNFNFLQVPEEYTHILWCDADDLYRNLDKLRPTIEANPHVDAFAFWYMYEFNDKKQPTVVHKKTQVIKNDDSFEWKGALHEDLTPNRSVDILFVEGIDRMHFTTDERVEIARKRNVEVSESEAQANPNDPRVYFNLGNSLIGDGQYKKAKESMDIFIEKSGSDEEKYIAYMRLALVEHELGNKDKAVMNYRMAIGLKPEYSDAYLKLGELLLTYDRLDEAEEYLLMGIVKKPPYKTIIVYNPREYDYMPMNNLAKLYFKKNRPDLALPMLKGCLAIYPDDHQLQMLVEEMSTEATRLENVIGLVQELDLIEDKELLKKRLNEIPEDLQSHPGICNIRNKNFIKTESSGKDITYYCGLTAHTWNPELAKTEGIGGSEEAVINLSKEWAKQGYNVTVYNNCGTRQIVCDGVTYKPFWEFNHRDKTDILVIWRHPKLLDFDVNATKIYVDMHDVISPGEFNTARIAKLDKVFLKTHFHRSLFPNIPDNKVEIVPNGMDFELFKQKVKKDQYMLVNTSSPDRSMDVLPKLFKKIKERVPQARLKWAYGWDVFDASHSTNKQLMDWRYKIAADMEESGIEIMGRLSQKDCAKLYLEGNILAYPTEFAEIDCITVKKAQACGAMPITTDFGAMPESVRTGVLIPSPKNKDTWTRDFKFSYGIEDESVQNKWVDAVVKQLEMPLDDRKEMKEKMNRFKWDTVSKEWTAIWI